MIKKYRQQSHKRTLILIFTGIAINSLYLLFTALRSFTRHHAIYRAFYGIEVLPLIAITLLYLDFLLIKRKRNAWISSIVVYSLYLAEVIRQRLTHDGSLFKFDNPISILNFFIPILILLGLIFSRKIFDVRSDVNNFKFSIKVSVLVLVFTLIFGSTGYMIMDNNDFHQEISVSGAIHQTIDQFGLTVDSPYVPYTERAKVFNETLSVISTMAIFYCLFSLFKPIQLKFSDVSKKRNQAIDLLSKGQANSEDFFKIWPRDKFYFFNKDGSVGISYTVKKGVAIVVGDPFGAVAHFSKTVDMFLNYCYTNDWQPAFVHTEPHFNKLYENHDFSLQLIGQEAVVDCHHFEKHVKNNKYFRNISNRFIKLNYAIEVLKPPHSDVVINRLKQISDEWLQLPSKGERGFVIGYFNKNYLNSCTILVLKDSTGKIQAFINKIPSFKAETASYDMIRYSNTCPGNCIDYLLINFIDYVYSSGFKKINLGLSPLAGVDSNDENNTLLNKSLSFIYSRGDRIYSFSGLNRFKSKFEPNWSNRYIAYTGGIRGFVRTVSALNKASKKINKN